MKNLVENRYLYLIRKLALVNSHSQENQGVSLVSNTRELPKAPMKQTGVT